MAHPEPHPRALFSLTPLTERADAVLDHPSNAHLLSRLIDGTLVLDMAMFAQYAQTIRPWQQWAALGM